ncbi:hypothetical protein [Marinilactibacillus sp. Marseille-P9653]|uniref:hypothetical protein n=1 Tax=Marinilactibacillus sp. Marseille-P9653 TaxID=2866583 RepID=UPI001CE46F88|nr:hypothetical protein [Marinilactibacillus sp. Marseille-P9653]
MVGKDIYLKHTEAIGIISHAYHELFRKRNDREETSFVLVGGLSAEIYTAGDYTTLDIDVLLSDDRVFSEVMDMLEFVKEGKSWYRDDINISIEVPSGPFAGNYDRRRQIKTAEEYIINIQSPEDIFADRVRAYVNWDEENHIKTLTTLWKLHELDTLYIESNLETPEEREFLEDFQKFYHDSARQSVKLESKVYYINLSDGDIDSEPYEGHEYLEISNGIKTSPSEYTRNNGDFATLVGELVTLQVEFKIDSTSYYESDSETGFTIYEVTKLDGKSISSADFIKEYAPHLAKDSNN